MISGSAAGIEYFIVPKENEAEARIQQGVRIFGVETLREALECLYTIEAELRTENNSESNGGDKNSGAPAREAIGHTGNLISTAASWSEPSQADAAANTGTGGFFEEVYGQGELVRALHIAAAGGHSVLAYGPPGCGKTLSMQRFASLLPDLDPKTAEEVTHIYSIAGLLPSMRGYDVRIKRPPFRMPHPNASLEGMIGGAGKCMPGEISLAHGGTLFLDEAVQFKQTVLQTLRAPLETGTVTLSRAGRATTFPARFQLLMALNSCPCGNLGADGKVCTCMPTVVEQYWKKLTAPLIDRIDLRIPVFPPQAYGLPEKPCYNTADMRKKIATSDKIQRERYAAYLHKGLNSGAAVGTPVYNKTADSSLAGTAQSAAQLSYKNVHLTPSALSAVCPLTGEAERIFTHNAKKKELSGRGSHSVLKIARTIADLAQEEVIAAPHIEEAIRLREWSSFLPFFMH